MLLLSWADRAFKNENPALHRCGLSLLDSLFYKHGEKLPEPISKMKYANNNNIDVLCILNGEYAVLIEEKVGTKLWTELIRMQGNAFRLI